jgi:hypothetical protein
MSKAANPPPSKTTSPNLCWPTSSQPWLPFEEAASERLKKIWHCLLLRRNFIKRELAVLDARQRELALRHFDLIAKVLSD